MLNLLEACIAYVNACRKVPVNIHFIYLGNTEIYCILKTCSHNINFVFAEFHL
jgi:hypothetical protein